MATLIDISRHPGILRGEGIESNCTVEMEEVIALGLPPVHVGHHITGIDKDLPEGDYQLFVHDVVVASLHFKVSARPEEAKTACSLQSYLSIGSLAGTKAAL